MAYKWKPNAAQKIEFAERMREKEKLPIINPAGAIRTGCKVEFYSTNIGDILKGEVVKHSYGAERNQHTFTILLFNGEKKLVKGRNLYPNLLSHVQGKESLKDSY
ncbi:hypothetical protein [Flavobacterium sp.]|uniref:hypothetical protein n=1 Tax=Flavobacterium sp. TaxID=239 RepID=UPI00375335DB